MSNWNERTPPERVWKPRAGLSGTARTAEQDRAAGGRHIRWVDLGKGRLATASVALRVYSKTRRVRAYLRWSDQGRTKERYLGEVDATTRARNLAEAWKLAKTSDLLAIPETAATNSWASSSAVRAVMKANKSRDTKPEKLLRSKLHQMGLRFRVSARPIPDLRRTADIVFSKAKLAIFVDGCYWHGCPEHYRPAKNQNVNFWNQKIESNRTRDKNTDLELRKHGWTVIRVWEHADPQECAEAIAAAVKERR